MNLYREKGVNPGERLHSDAADDAGALRVLRAARPGDRAAGRGFGLWIHDLSQPDPYYVIPVLMGATMFWQQRMTPATADPAQQQMMMFMPVMFGVHLPDDGERARPSTGS